MRSHYFKENILDKETFSFNRQQQPEALPLDPASMKMIAFAVSP